MESTTKQTHWETVGYHDSVFVDYNHATLSEPISWRVYTVDKEGQQLGVMVFRDRTSAFAEAWKRVMK